MIRIFMIDAWQRDYPGQAFETEAKGRAALSAQVVSGRFIRAELRRDAVVIASKP